MSNLDPATVHARSIAMVRHAARGDHAETVSLLPDLSGPEEAAAQIVSLLQLAVRLLAEIPDGDQLLNGWALHIAQAHDHT